MSFKFPTSLPSLQSLSQSLNETFDQSLKASQKLTSEITPFAKKTQRLIQEKLGNIEDVSELPEEYTTLEKKCDAIHKIYKKLIDVCSVYELESYDYPPNLKESFNDVSKTISEKFHGLANANSAQEAEKVLSASAGSAGPKTLYHALSRASYQAREELGKISEGEDSSSLSKALLLLAQCEKSIGDKRLAQDATIITQFNYKLNAFIDELFKETMSTRKRVYYSRLNFDIKRQDIKSGDGAKEEKERELEIAEDELVNSTELAVKSMKKLIDPLESINLIKVLAVAQLDYFKSAVSDLESLVTDLESLPVESIDEE